MRQPKQGDLREPLSVVHLGNRKQGVHGVVSGNEETGQIGQQLAAVVQEDEEEVDESKSPNHIDFGNICSCRNLS